MNVVAFVANVTIPQTVEEAKSITEQGTVGAVNGYGIKGFREK